MIWIGLGLLMISNSDVQDIISPLLDNWTVAVLLLGAIAYPSGLIIDEIADLLLSGWNKTCLLYTSPSPRDRTRARMPSSA